MTEEYFVRVIAICIIFFIIFAIRGIFACTHYLNKMYVIPAKENHTKKLEKYIKYLRECDKKGKTPLSYKLWKLAYATHK